VTILFAYDGSHSADIAIAAAGNLLDHDRVDAVVLTVWEPLVVEALRATRFGGAALVPTDVTEVDKDAEKQARRLADHGARLAGEAGFEARALSVADERRIAATILERADELDAALIVTGARGLTGIAAFVGSVSNHVLQHATRPVLVVPSQQDKTIDLDEGEARVSDRDSGEDAYASKKEEAREISPSGMTRVKTDGI
jgi:nucleotide-binding universal stress UspA family protein